MPRLAHALALALSLATSEAAIQGFNYGSTNADGSNKGQADFESAFSTAKNLVGTSGFTSARLYTMIQGGTTNTPIEAIPAAIAQDTSLLLGLWTSGGNIENELAALQSAITQYGEDFTKLVVGISVGSEDLYRDSIIGAQTNAGVGIGPDELVSYISRVRSLIAGTSLSGASIGHVDTWTAWVNSSNAEVVNALDWIGFDGYPYFQNTMSNSIDDAKELFDEAVAATKSAAGGKPVWITETGWPVSGNTENLAVPSIANAKTYWDEVGCPLFGNTNVWWYTLQDADSVTPNPSFGIVGSTLSTTPLFDLSCSNVSSASSAAASSTVISASSTLATGVASTATGSAGVPGSGSPAGVPASGSSAGVPGSGARPAASSSPATTSVALFGGSSGSAASSAVAGSASAAVSSKPVSVPSKGPVASSSSHFITATASGSSQTSSGTSNPSSTVSTLPFSGASTLSGSVFGAVAALFVFIAAL